MFESDEEEVDFNGLRDFMESFRLHDTDPRTGITFSYFKIPKNTILYTGNLDFPDPVPYGNLSFFGFDIETAELYGPVYKFVTTAPEKVLALDDVRTKQMLDILADQEIENTEPGDEKRIEDLLSAKRILRENYGLETNRRNSEPRQDWHFVTEFLCKLNLGEYNGYALNFMETAGGGHFHREVAFCRAPNVEILNNGETLSNRKFIQAFLEKKNERIRQKELLKARKKRRTTDEEENMFSPSSAIATNSATPFFGNNLLSHFESEAPAADDENVYMSSEENTKKRLFNDDNDEGIGGSFRKRKTKRRSYRRTKRTVKKAKKTKRKQRRN